MIPDRNAVEMVYYRHPAGDGEDRLADDHPTNETNVPQAREGLKELTEFVRKKTLVRVHDEPVESIVTRVFSSWDSRGLRPAFMASSRSASMLFLRNFFTSPACSASTTESSSVRLAVTKSTGMSSSHGPWCET